MNNNKCWWTQLYTDDIGTILLDDRSQSDLIIKCSLYVMR